jgi:hypothetical protein
MIGSRKMASKPIYQCCAECEDFEPKIWHCFQVSNNVEIPKFGYIFMIMFVMLAPHLFQIEVPSGNSTHQSFHNDLSKD